jgi:hypothetical protein
MPSGMAVDMGQPDVVRLKNKTEGHKINVLLASLIKGKMELVNSSLTGIAVSGSGVPSVANQPGVRGKRGFGIIAPGKVGL